MSYNVCWTQKDQQFWLIDHIDAENLENIQNVQAIPIQNVWRMRGRIHPLKSSIQQLPKTEISNVFNTIIH